REARGARARARRRRRSQRVAVRGVPGASRGAQGDREVHRGERAARSRMPGELGPGAELLEAAGEVGRERRGDVDRAAVGGREHEPRRVEREAVEVVAGAEQPVVLALAVADVADERAGNVLQVAADLVEAAGARPRLDERVAAE